MKVLVVYHAIDFDGLCSYAIVRRMEEREGNQVDGFGYNYGWEWPSSSILSAYDKIYVVDCCLPGEMMSSIDENCRLVWIDHHFTSINGNPDLGHVDGIRREGVGACQLCWEYCFPNEEAPAVVGLLSRYDVWDQTDGLWEEATLPFQYGMRNRFNLDVEKFYGFFCAVCDGANGLLQEAGVLSDGKAILSYVRQVGLNACGTYGFEVGIADGAVKGLCLLTPHFGAVELEEAMAAHGCQVAVCVNRLAKDGTYKVSVYAGKNKPELNIGEYMREHYSGGGHRAAAGGTMTREQFLRLLDEHRL